MPQERVVQVLASAGLVLGYHLWRRRNAPEVVAAVAPSDRPVPEVPTHIHDLLNLRSELLFYYLFLVFNLQFIFVIP